MREEGFLTDSRRSNNDKRFHLFGLRVEGMEVLFGIDEDIIRLV
jgi:hypothetical protein